MKRSLLHLLLLVAFLHASTLAVGAEEKSAGSHFNRGINNVMKHQYDQAIADFTKAIELNPRDETYKWRGITYMRKGQYDRALADFTKALELNPRLAAAYANRGRIYIEKGQYDRAIAQYNKALELAPRAANSSLFTARYHGRERARMYTGRAKAYYFKKDYDNAWKDVHKVKSLGTGIERHPQFKDFLDELSQASGRALSATMAIAGMNKDLVEAVKRDDLPKVKRLLAKGADVNAKTEFGWTALISASYNGNREVVEALLAKGAEVNAQITDMGTTALMAASQEGHREVVQLLLDKGAEVNAQDVNGATALLIASRGGHKDIQEMLIKAGAK